MTNFKAMAVSRMKLDYLSLKRDPLPYITAEPLPWNLLEWHYIIRGAENSPYEGGYYHGKLIFPPEFPFKPPSICMLTPNGRFQINTQICLNISDFHPDSWNPTWSVGSILMGLLSFMMENTPTTGSAQTTLYEKQQYATKSLEFNLKNSNFRKLFPEVCDEIKVRLEGKQELLQGNGLVMTESQTGARFTGNTNNAIDLIDKLPSGTTNSLNKKTSTLFSILFLISFFIFALTASYVIGNLNE